MTRPFVISVLVAALLLAGLVFFLHSQNPAYDMTSLMIGNAILAGVSLTSFYIISQGMKTGNANAFVRAKLTGTMLKFFVCIAVLLVYIFVKEKIVHKPSLFLFLGMYIVYSAIEAVPLSRMAKKV